jgi:hypothetical protein
MHRESFRKEIERELRKLDKTSAVHFAWRCAMYALPFLGRNGNFDFWKQQDRQKHLLAVLRAIDTCKSFVLRSSFSDWNAAAYAAYAADAAAYAYAAADAADATAYAYAAARANADAAAVDAAARAAHAAVFAADATVARFQHILLEDLSNIKNSEKFSKASIIPFYGETWNKFQKALNNTGCSYWADLYQHLFEKNFVFDDEDKDALHRRLNEVPAEIL